MVDRFPDVVVDGAAPVDQPRATAWGVGSGIAGTADQEPLVCAVLAVSVPVVLDAGALTILSISAAVRALVRDRADAVTRVYSMNLADKGVIEFSMSGLAYDAAKDWANYFMGVVSVFEKAGYKAPHGFDIVINGTLPGGAGLSSSWSRTCTGPTRRPSTCSPTSPAGSP